MILKEYEDDKPCPSFLNFRLRKEGRKEVNEKMEPCSLCSGEMEEKDLVEVIKKVEDKVVVVK